jgi:cell division protein FtsN
MTTKRLVLDLVAFVFTLAFLLYVLPKALNAHSTAVNALGIAVIVGLAIGLVAVVHKKLTQTEEDDKDA